MTWCFNCESVQNGDHLALCKSLGHDIDSDHQFQITNNETKDKIDKPKDSPIKILAKLATLEMTKVCTSQSDNTRVFAVVKMKNHFENVRGAISVSEDRTAARVEMTYLIESLPVKSTLAVEIHDGKAYMVQTLFHENEISFENSKEEFNQVLNSIKYF